MDRNLRPVCAPRLGLRDRKSRHVHPIETIACQVRKGAAGPREGKDRPRVSPARTRVGNAPGTEHLQSRLPREANRYATRPWGASEAIQIPANRDECGYQYISLIRRA